MGSRRQKRKAQKERELCNRPKKYKKWSEELMMGAMKAVADGLFSVNKAADEFGVPRLTLKDRLSGKLVHGARSEPTLSLWRRGRQVCQVFVNLYQYWSTIDKGRGHWHCAEGSDQEARDKGFNGKCW